MVTTGAQQATQGPDMTSAGKTKDAVKSGALAALTRLGRGLGDMPGAIAWWVGARSMDADIAAAAPGDPTTKAILVQQATARDRRILLATIICALVGWLSGGWWPIAVTYGAATVLAGIAAWNKHTPWVWVARWGTVLAVTVAAEWIHLMGGVPLWVMDGGLVGVAVAWLIYAAGDGSVRDNLPGVQHADGIRTTPKHRVVHALVEALGLNQDRAEEFIVIGAGLKQVDDIWSEIVIQTPGTITTAKIVDSSARLAAVMGIPASRVSISEDGAEGVVRIAIADRDQWAEPKRWPLIDADSFSVWNPLPFATDERGRVVTVTLMFAGWLIAAVPRVGKTFALRLIVLAWLLDDTADVILADFKGGRDFTMCKPACETFIHGNSDESVRAFRDRLQKVLDDSAGRKAAFNALPSAVVPNGQLTREAVAADKRLRPTLIAADEVHWATSHEEYGEEIVGLLAAIAKDLPYLGVEEALASQRIDAKETMPTKLRNVLSNRLGLKLHSSADSKMILGDAANGLGFNAAALPKVKGLGILHGTDDSSSIDGYVKVRTFFHSGMDAEQIAARAIERRRDAGVLRGGVDEPPAPELVAVAEILRASGKRSMRSEDVAARLGTTPQRLREKTGVKARQHPEDDWRRHLFLDDIESALAGKAPAAASLRVVGGAAG